VLSAFEEQGCAPHAAEINEIVLSTYVLGLLKTRILRQEQALPA
jgi:hypothetical protein